MPSAKVSPALRRARLSWAWRGRARSPNISWCQRADRGHADGVAPEVGASFRANYLTALYALGERAKLKAGETLLVLGAAGGTGIAAVQVGKLLGARVIAGASTQDKARTSPGNTAPMRPSITARPTGATR